MKTDLPTEDLNPQTSSAKLPWNPWWAVLFVIVVYFLSQLIGQLAVSLYPQLQHWSPTQTEQWLSSSLWAQFFYVCIAEAFTVWALWFFLNYFTQRKVNWQAIGLRRPRWSDPLAGLAMLVPYFITYIAVFNVCQKLFPHLDVNQTQQLGFDNVAGVGPLIVTFISLVILPPFVEELLVRGFLYTTLRGYIPKLLAALVASAIFASGHLQFGSGAPLLWIAFIDTFILSLFLIFLREKTKGLYASMTLHALKNFIAFMSLFIFHVH